MLTSAGFSPKKTRNGRGSYKMSDFGSLLEAIMLMAVIHLFVLSTPEV